MSPFLFYVPYVPLFSFGRSGECYWPSDILGLEVLVTKKDSGPRLHPPVSSIIDAHSIPGFAPPIDRQPVLHGGCRALSQAGTHLTGNRVARRVVTRGRRGVTERRKQGAALRREQGRPPLESDSRQRDQPGYRFSGGLSSDDEDVQVQTLWKFPGASQVSRAGPARILVGPGLDSQAVAHAQPMP